MGKYLNVLLDFSSSFMLNCRRKKYNSRSRFQQKNIIYIFYFFNPENCNWVTMRWLLELSFAASNPHDLFCILYFALCLIQWMRILLRSLAGVLNFMEFQRLFEFLHIIERFLYNLGEWLINGDVSCVKKNRWIINRISNNFKSPAETSKQIPIKLLTID
jgi:hypothetical protein